jgi:uncharacterized protein
MRWLITVVLLGLVVTLLATCARITVNVYFPAAEIRNAAQEIEGQVRQPEATPPEEVPPKAPAAPQKPQSSDPGRPPWTLHLAWGAAPVIAQQQLNLNVSTPAIRSLIASRQQRYPNLVSLFTQGVLGENNRGLVEIRPSPDLSLQDKARATTLSTEENRDRQQLYAELAKANNIPPGRIAEVGSIFADVNRQQAQAGWWIQGQDGAWKHK